MAPLPFGETQDVTHGRGRQFSAGVFLAIVVAVFASAGHYVLTLYGEYSAPHAAELSYSSYSPVGKVGGSVVPASCESGYEHWAGECAAAPMGYHDRLDCRVIQGWTCDPNNAGYRPLVHVYRGGPAGVGTFIGGAYANEFRPDLPGHPAVCGGFPDGQYQYTFYLPATHENGTAQSYYVYAIDDNSYGWAGNPLLTNSPRVVSCYLPPPTNLQYACVLGPTGQRQLRMSWTRAPGYPTVYLRTRQNGVYPYAPGTSENYTGDSVTFNITPGASYDFWMHTRDWNGSYSDAGSINGIVCNNPPPPTSPSSQCTYDAGSNTFTARISWNAPAGYNTFQTRVSTSGLYDTNVATRVAGTWNDNFVGTTFTFPASRNTTSDTPRYYWWVETKNTTTGWWSSAVTQQNVTGAQYLVCPLPPPRAPSSMVATCPSVAGNTSNMATFQMSAQFATAYDIEFTRFGDSMVSINNVTSPHVRSNMTWGAYTWRARGRNVEGGSTQLGTWSGLESFDCLPPPPVINLTAVPSLVRTGSSAQLTWSVTADYELLCTVSGGTTIYSFTHTSGTTNNPNHPNPYLADPVSNTTDFTVSCTPQIPGLTIEPTTRTARVEVVPNLQEI